MNSAHVSRLLQQTQHHDSDERYMATSDLIAALSAVDGLIDAGLQLPIRNAVLKQLTDKSIDVQAVAVKVRSRAACDDESALEKRLLTPPRVTHSNSA